MPVIVQGRGNKNARGVILGEAPGAEEEKQGRPFVGRSGELLSRVLAGAQLREEELWITNVIKIRPEGNRTPYNREVDDARLALFDELIEIAPACVLGLGNVPLYAMTMRAGGITEVRGTFDETSPWTFLPTYHPSYVLRNGGLDSSVGREFVRDVNEFAKRVLGEEVGLSFFDEYKEVGGKFVGAEEKEVLMSNGIPFQVVDVIDDDTNKYGPRFIANVLLPNPEDGTEEQRSIGFPKGTVDSRDRMLSQMQEYLGRTDAQPVVVKLEKVGRSIIVRNAEAD